MSEHIEGDGFEASLDEDCQTCGHAFNPHVLVATLYSPEHGGMIFCPEPGCDCESTWSLEDRELPYIPDDETVAGLRSMVQSPDEIWEVDDEDE